MEWVTLTALTPCAVCVSEFFRSDLDRPDNHTEIPPGGDWVREGWWREAPATLATDWQTQRANPSPHRPLPLQAPAALFQDRWIRRAVERNGVRVRAE